MSTLPGILACSVFPSLLSSWTIVDAIGAPTLLAAALEGLSDFRLLEFVKQGQRVFPDHLHFDGLDWDLGFSEVWLYVLRNVGAGLRVAQLAGSEDIFEDVLHLERRLVHAVKHGEKSQRRVWKDAWGFFANNDLRTKLETWKELHAHRSNSIGADFTDMTGEHDSNTSRFNVSWDGAPMPNFTLGKPLLYEYSVPPDAHFHLANGITMPAIGLGTTMLNLRSGEDAILEALELGYRLIDTAQSYDNEKEVGQALHRSGIDRSEVFLCTKVSDPKFFHRLPKLFKRQLRDLGTDYVDLYFIHGPDNWPNGPLKAWRSMEKLYAEGKIRALGVSNFSPEQLSYLIRQVKVKPHVIQNKFSIYHWGEGPQPSKQNYLSEFRVLNIVLMGYSTLDCYPMVKQPLLDEHVRAIASAYRRTPAQILLRHALQLGVAVIPKSANSTRLKENLRVFDFHLSDESMALLNSLPQFTSADAVDYLPDVHSLASLSGPSVLKTSEL